LKYLQSQVFCLALFGAEIKKREEATHNLLSYITENLNPMKTTSFLASETLFPCRRMLTWVDSWIIPPIEVFALHHSFFLLTMNLMDVKCKTYTYTKKQKKSIRRKNLIKKIKKK